MPSGDEGFALLAARATLSAGILWILYQLLLAGWNLSPLHPLDRIPGPKLAAASYLPEFYYDTVKFGRYTKRIEKMHEKYGMDMISSETLE